jgi:hypothetical protein
MEDDAKEVEEILSKALHKSRPLVFGRNGNRAEPIMICAWQGIGRPSVIRVVRHAS